MERQAKTCDYVRMKLRLKELRKSKGWTQERVASELGISTPHVSEMETGKKNPSLKLMDDLARLYGIPVTGLYALEATDDDTLTLAKMRKLTPENRRFADEMIERLAAQGGNR